MTLLPIVERELRVSARRPNTYWSRFAAALLALGIFAALWLCLPARGQAADRGQMAFYAVSGLAMLFAMFAGASVTADCLSQEKRNGTLGLLFLTDLKGYDVVLGKLAASSLQASSGLLGILPVLALPLLMGGVTGGEVGRVALVITNTLFFSLAVGVSVSAFSRREVTGPAVTLIVLLAAALGPLLVLAVPASAVTVPLTQAVLTPSPGFAFVAALAPYHGPWRFHFFFSLGLTHCLGWLALAVASFILPRIWLDRPANGRILGWPASRTSPAGPSSRRGRFRTRMLNRNPVSWLTGRHRRQSVYIWACLALLAILWGCGWAHYGTFWTQPTSCLVTSFLLHGFIKARLITKGCQQLQDDRKSGALELLLCTPLSIREILGGQRLALRRQFLGPILTILLADFCLMLAAFHAYRSASEDRLIFLAGMFFLLADTWTLSWAAPWQGLTARNLNRAFSTTAMLVLVLPWAAFLGVFIVSVYRSIMGRGTRASSSLMLWIWVGLSFAIDLLVAIISFWKLSGRFRLEASEPYRSRWGLKAW